MSTRRPYLLRIILRRLETFAVSSASVALDGVALPPELFLSITVFNLRDSVSAVVLLLCALAPLLIPLAELSVPAFEASISSFSAGDCDGIALFDAATPLFATAS